MKKILVACACFTLAAHANPFDTPLGKDSLDPAAFAEWTGGAEQPLTDNPRDVLWTQTTQPDWKGVKFGDTKMPGPRHLRLGWQTPVAVGSVLARAIGQLSVLKPDANYPGRLDNDTDWLPAARLAGAEPVADAYVVWTLPPGTTTRALRFTHVTAPLDKSYAGWVGGVFVLPARLANLAPAAQVFTSHNQKYAGKLTDGSNNNIWGTWDNAPDADTPVVSPEHPVAITLAWPKPVTLCGLNALWAGFTAADVQTYTGPANRHPREATETDWQTIRSCDKIENQYPRPLGVNWLDFGTNLTTRAIRLRIARRPTRALRIRT